MLFITFKINLRKNNILFLKLKFTVIIILSIKKKYFYDFKADAIVKINFKIFIAIFDFFFHTKNFEYFKRQ